MSKMFDAYRITSMFGPRKSPITGQQEFHTGVDLVKRTGGKNAPIEAFVDGTVIDVYNDKEAPSGTGYGGFGCIIAIRDRFGYTHLYAHMKKGSIRFKKGDQVKAGQVVGLQGSTGKSTGEHLHYEVRRYGYGSHVEPLEYLASYEERELKEALDVLAKNNVINSPDYWLLNAKAGKTVRGDYAALLIKNMARRLQK